MPALDALGWNAELASAFEQLQDDNLFPARIAAQHRGEFALLAEEGEVRARAAGRLFYAHEVGGQLPAVGD
ncbi:MAG: ribosome small subunit-dependent GTPase A, partial [Gaiellaceae bacterium]